jgi:UDP-glucose 4-epimerase
MKVLIAGGFGFVGGRLGQAMRRAGHRVVLGSRHERSAPTWLRDAEVRQTRWHDAGSLSDACSGMDIVIHAAGMNAQDSSVSPVAAFDANALGTGRLAVAARAAGVRRFMYLSTAHVYASALVGRITEDSCTQNVHPYAASHRAGEDLVRHVFAGSGGAVVVRLSNAFGAPLSADAPCWTLLVNDLCRQAATTGQLVLRSSGLQQRDFVTLSDACAAIRHLAVSAEAPSDSAILNVGSGTAMTVLAMAELIRQRADVVLGFPPEIVRPDAGANAATSALDFDVGRLTRTGFRGDADIAGELDGLLRFCRDAFGGERVVRP